MATGLIEIMKRAALEADDNAKPCDLRYGTVTSKKPLKIQITNQFVLPESMLVVPQHLTNYKVDIILDGVTKNITIKNELKTGDKVVLVRQRGGQSYFILDRIK